MSSTKSKLRPAIALVIIAIIVVAGGVYYYNMNQQQPPPKPRVPKILQMACDLDVTTWDPSGSYSTEVMEMANMYEPLIWANPPGSSEPIKPALATSWEVSPDGLNWTFHLRSGVKFHDGTPLNAEAVKYSINRTKSMGLGAAFLWSYVNSVDVVDNLTVRLNLAYAAPITRIVSAEYAGWIFSPKSAANGTAWFEQGHDAGSGPFMLESYKPRDEIVLTRFQDYWGGWNDTQFDKIDIHFVSDPVEERQMLESGDADIACTVPIESVPILNQTNGLIIYRSPSFFNYVGYMNTAKAPLNNVLVRQAISYAIPYQDLINVAQKGMATQAVGPVPKGLWPNQPGLPQYTHNLTKAKELLTEAGYPNGLSLVLTFAQENAAEQLFAPMIKSELAKIGVTVDVRGIPWVEQWAMAKQDPQKAQDIFLIEWWPSMQDGYDELSGMFHSESSVNFNLNYWYNSTFDNLIDTAFATETTNPTQSAKMYFDAQKMLIDNAVALYLYDFDALFNFHTYIQGFVSNPYYPSVIFFYQLYTLSSQTTSSAIQPTSIALLSTARQIETSLATQAVSRSFVWSL
jgi:peptide/nickel transport system substrate-binding protein